MRRWTLLELRQILREPKFWIPLLVPQLLYFCAGYYQYLVFNSPFPLVSLGILCGGLTVSLASDRISGERERGGLEILLLSNMNRHKLIFMKWMVVFLPSQFIYLFFLGVLFGVEPELFQWQKVLSGELFLWIVSCVNLVLNSWLKTARSASQWGVLLLLGLLGLGFYFDQGKSVSLGGAQTVALFVFFGVVAYFSLLRGFRKNILPV